LVPGPQESVDAQVPFIKWHLHSPVRVKSSIDHSSYLIQFKCYLNNCTVLFREWGQEKKCASSIQI
jgi:hypothetical protein